MPLPLTSVAEAIKAAVISRTVTRRSRWGVIQLKRLEANQDLVPVATAPLLIAVIMHCMHMLREH